MNNGNELLMLFIMGIIVGGSLVWMVDEYHAYDVYMDGVDDCAEFYKFFGDTDKDVDIDFWVDFADDRFYDRYYDFKEAYINEAD